MSKEVKNVAMLLTGFDTKKKSEKKQFENEQLKKKQYGLPKGFKLIGFDVRN